VKFVSLRGLFSPPQLIHRYFFNCGCDWIQRSLSSLFSLSHVFTVWLSLAKYCLYRFFVSVKLGEFVFLPFPFYSVFFFVAAPSNDFYYFLFECPPQVLPPVPITCGPCRLHFKWPALILSLLSHSWSGTGFTRQKHTPPLNPSLGFCSFCQTHQKLRAPGTNVPLPDCHRGSSMSPEFDLPRKFFWCKPQFLIPRFLRKLVSFLSRGACVFLSELRWISSTPLFFLPCPKVWFLAGCFFVRCLLILIEPAFGFAPLPLGGTVPVKGLSSGFSARAF